MPALSVEFLWQLHGVLFHVVQHANGLQNHLAQSSYAVTAAFAAAADCELVLAFSLAVLCVLTVLPPVTIIRIEPVSHNIATSCS